MFDNLTQSADGLLIGIFIVSLVVFFLFGPHKVYESIFGALFGLGMYLFIHEMTFVFPDVTRTLFFGQWMFDNRGALLWSAKVATLILFFLAPATIGINVSGVVRGTFIFFIKLMFLSTFFVCFAVVLFSFMYGGNNLFGQVTLLPGAPLEIPFLQKSIIYIFIVNHAHIILFFSFLFAFYKILLSHWISTVFISLGLMYMKGSQVFGKKDFNPMSVHDAPLGDDSESSDEHGPSHGHH